jgi:long-chain acyl-CoA synthetase
LQTLHPTLFISEPRVFERVYSAIKTGIDEGPALRKQMFEHAVEVGWQRFEHEQGRAPWSPRLLLWPVLKTLVADQVLARLGGRVRVVISSDTLLPSAIAKIFIAPGLPILQGYGLTETSPVVSVNRIDDNLPASVGTILPGIEVKLGEQDALLVRGPYVMQGYWHNEAATRAMFTSDGWLNTGDVARIDELGHIFITGRLRDILVLSTGEKILPADMEAAILNDGLIDQVMVVGEEKPYLAAFAVINAEQWQQRAPEQGLPGLWPKVLESPLVHEWVMQLMAKQLHAFPSYAQIRRVSLQAEPWSTDNGLLTPTHKLKRGEIVKRFQADYNALYDGHV